jgi:spore germination protein YaaH
MQHAREQGVKNVLALHGPKTKNEAFNSTSEVYQLLANKSTRRNAVATACAIASKAGYDGISVDFEGPWTSNVGFHHVFSAFITEIAAACTALPTPLTVSAALAHSLSYDVAEDAAFIATAVTDGVVLMTYDYLFVGNGHGPTRPNAPLYADAYMTPPSDLNNVNSSIMYALQQSHVPASSLTIGIAWYGKEVPAVGPSMGAAMNISSSSSPTQGAAQRSHNFQQPLSAKRAVTLGGGRKWDNVSLTPWYSYKDPHRPWLFWQGFYDDAESLGYKYDLVKTLGLRGVLLWNLNACTLSAAPSMWQALEGAFGKK